jgi:hypothetical protein
MMPIWAGRLGPARRRSAGDELHRAGGEQRARDDQHQRDDDDGRIAEAREGLVRRHDAGQNRHDQGAEGDEIVPHPAPDQEREDDGDERRRGSSARRSCRDRPRLFALNATVAAAFPAGRNILSDAAAAVDLQRHAGDEFGLVGGEPQRGIGDVERCRQPPERDRGAEQARFSGVSSPMKEASMPVSPATGHRQLTRMFFGASSTAIDFVAVIVQPLEALYQVRPGRGRSPPSRRW